MIKRTTLLVLLLTSAWAGQWPSLSERNLAGDRVSFPELFQAHAWQLVALALSDDQEVGARQQEALATEQAWLLAQGWPQAQAPIYQMPVIAGAPRLVHGLIRRGLTSSNPEGQDKALVVPIFLSDAEQLLQPLQLRMTDQAHWLLVDRTGVVRWRHNGAMTNVEYQQLLAMINP